MPDSCIVIDEQKKLTATVANSDQKIIVLKGVSRQVHKCHCVL